MKLATILACCALVMAGSGPSLSQEGYPARPIRLVVGFPPGTATDLVARQIAEGADGPSMNRSIPIAKALDDAVIALYQNGERINPAQGFVFHRVYSDSRDLDESMAVEDRDVVLVPRGYHPVVLPHGYESYYFNVMAGPKRVWHFHNDPAHEWIVSANE